jgi:tripartite-type tricarboxylate transporter receptor subunit TctC
MIIPFPPGGSNDVVGRIIANQLGERLGKQVFVDNRSGAGGVVGSDLAAKATPDGYTLLIVSIAHSVDPWLYKEPFDPVKDFVPVSIIATGTNVLTVNPTVPVHSVKELLALAKEKPGVLNYASAGIGSFQHLSGELFKLTADVDIQHVPYKGGGPAMLAVIAGEAQVMFSSIVQTVPNIAARSCRSYRPSPKSACPATWRPIGGASSRPPARHSRSSTSSMTRSRNSSIPRRPKNISTMKAPRPCI